MICQCVYSQDGRALLFMDHLTVYFQELSQWNTQTLMDSIVEFTQSCTNQVQKIYVNYKPNSKAQVPLWEEKANEDYRKANAIIPREVDYFLSQCGVYLCSSSGDLRVKSKGKLLEEVAEKKDSDGELNLMNSSAVLVLN